MRLSILGVDDKKASASVEKILKKSENIDINEAVKLIYAEINFNSVEDAKPKTTIKDSNIKTTNVLKDIVNENKNNKTIYQSLLDEGYIKNPMFELAI